MARLGLKEYSGIYFMDNENLGWYFWDEDSNRMLCIESIINIQYNWLDFQVKFDETKQSDKVEASGKLTDIVIVS